MPIYEYKCLNCNYRCEFLQTMSDSPIKYCPKCGKGSLERCVSLTSFKLKGKGWYETDYKAGLKEEGKKENKGGDNKETKQEVKQEKASSAEKKEDKTS